MHVVILTLVLGMVLGYLAQRSRMCFIGGLRDFLLVGDTALLKGMIAFLVTAWFAYSLAGIAGLTDWQPPQFVSLVAGQAPLEADIVLTDRIQPAHLEKSWEVSEGQSIAGDITSDVWRPFALAVGGGLVLGLVSVLANGCPVRQHVLAIQGVRDAVFYLVGFYMGVVVFYFVTKPLLRFF